MEFRVLSRYTEINTMMKLVSRAIAPIRRGGTNRRTNRIGGSVTLDSTTAAGTYVGTFNVTVDY